ncbi:MAG: MFS transporter [Pseudomonadota bacterium]
MKRMADASNISDTTSTAGTQDGRSPYAALFMVVFISLVGFGIVIPVFPFFGRMVGASAQEITLAMAAYSLGQFIGAPVWGRMSDRYGRRPSLIWSLIASALAYMLMAHSGNIWWLGLSRLLGGLMAGNLAAAFAYVGDVTTDATRPKAMGLLGAAFGSGFIFGPAIGGLIAGAETGPSDFLYIGYASAAFTILAAVMTYFTVAESLSPERRAAAAHASSSTAAFATATFMRAKPVVFWLAAIMFLSTSAGALMEATFAFLASDRFTWGPREIGLSFAMIGSVAAVLQAVATQPLAARFGVANVMTYSLIIYAGGLLGIGLAQTNLQLALGLAANAVGVGLFSPAYQSYTAGRASDADRGLVMGITQSAGSLGRVIGPAVAGVIYVGVSPPAPFYIGAAVMLLSLFVAAHTVKRYGR